MSLHSSRLKKALRVVVPLLCTILLILWLLHKTDMGQLRQALHQPIAYRYIIMMMLFTVAAHVIRGIRWGIQLRGVGIPRMPVMAEASSIMGAYALNIFVPYLGETWRCIYVSRRQHAKLTLVVGTDLGDRISDLIVVIAMVLLTMIVAPGAMAKLFHAIGSMAGNFHPSTFDISTVAVVLAVALALGAWYIIHHHKKLPVANIIDGIKRINRGFDVLFHMQGKVPYVILTLGIWICYFLQTYCCIFAFPYTRALVVDPAMCYGLLPALVAFVFGSCSMCIPSNGGLGPWNISIVLALTIYGISTVEATAWSLVYWMWQTVAQFAGGLIALIYIWHHRNILRKFVGSTPPGATH